MIRTPTPNMEKTSNSCSPDTDSARRLHSSAAGYQLNGVRATGLIYASDSAAYRISLIKRYNYGPAVTDTSKLNIAQLKRVSGVII